MRGKWDAFPLLRQKDQMDCGPACLKMLIKYYKLPEPNLNELRKLCNSSRGGVSLSHLLQAAKHFGFQVEAVKTQISELIEVENPCILLYNSDHYVVHYAFQEGCHWIADPAVGIINFSTEELQEHWYIKHQMNGIMLLFTPPKECQSIHDKTKMPSLWNRFSGYLPRFKHQLGWLILCFLLSGFFAMMLPMMLQVIVDVAVVQKDWSVLIVFVVAQFCLYTGQLSSEIVRTWIVLGMGTFVNLDRVSLFFKQLVRLKWPFFADRMLGDIMLRIDDHKRIEKFLLGPAMELVQYCVCQNHLFLTHTISCFSLLKSIILKKF
jgi:ATP-binding cassette subfamily B protein